MGLIAGSDKITSALPNNAPEWTSTPGPSFTAGTSSNFDLTTVTFDADADSITFTTAPSSNAFPANVILSGSNIVASASASAGTTTGIFVVASDGTANTTSPSFSIVVVSANDASQHYPRIAIVWQGQQSRFDDDPRAWHKCLVADYMVCNPDSSQVTNYGNILSAVTSMHSTFKPIRYISPLEMQQTPEATEIAACKKISTPGGGAANDGVARNAAGTICGSGFGGSPTSGGNISPNLTTSPTPYSASVSTSADDRSLPRQGERPIDYVTRAEYYRTLNPSIGFAEGGFFDLFNRRDFIKSPTRCDSDNDGANEEIDEETRWTPQLVRMAHLMFGDNLGGSGDAAPLLDSSAPGARSNGEPWYNKNSTPLVVVNGVEWQSDGSSDNGLTETNTYLNTGVAPSTITAYLSTVCHGGLVEFGFGGTSAEAWFGGLTNDGTPNRGPGSFPNSVDIVMAMAQLVNRHCIVYPGTGLKMTSIEARGSNYEAVSHYYLLGCMTDSYVHTRSIGGFAESSASTFIFAELDEMVGANVSAMSSAQVFATRNWMGAPVTPAWPNLVKTDGSVITSDGSADSVDDDSAVWVREFENCIIFAIPGRSHAKNVALGYPNANDCTEVASVEMSLFPAGSGFKWKKINGGQRPTWNDGADVSATAILVLGSTENSINKNSILLLKTASA